ncbi:MAG: ABC transporter permease [Parasulfuritortus sp.]|jgi:peptide/nickel transport system permease protein|nr:ABC transporter permease [Parasulfuritortus sp.]
MIAYLIRRLLYALPILLGVNLLTFALFFLVNTPDDMARLHLGVKRVTPDAVEKWKAARGYDKPLFVNARADGLGKVTDTIFFDKSLSMFAFHFGVSDDDRDIANEIKTRMWPSLAIALPTFVIGLMVNVSVALILIFFRRTYVEWSGVVALVALMSVSGLFYIIGGQFLFAKVWQLAPISGYQSGLNAARFVWLPILVGIVGGVGSGARWYRTLFLEEANKDYVRTARAKGLSETAVLFRHILKNGMVPILTGAVAVFPLLFMGSLILESFFGIPGLGSYTINAINSQDFAIVRAMVFLGAVLYIVGLILTDVSYTLVDPRVRLS